MLAAARTPAILACSTRTHQDKIRYVLVATAGSDGRLVRQLYYFRLDHAPSGERIIYCVSTCTTVVPLFSATKSACGKALE
jgi:hypothetical protein